MPVAVFPLQDTIACQRGCRLLSICQFVDGISGLNSTRAECEAACLEAYSQTDEQYGCTTGCREQFLEAERRQKQLLTSTSETPSFSLIHYVSNLCSDFVNSAQSFISSTWTFYLQADDGKVVVFQANPEVDFSSLDLEPSLPNETENPQDGIPGVQEQEEELPTPRTTPATLELQPAAAEGVRKESDSRAIAEPAVKEKLTDGEGSHTQHDFLACMSRRSGLPRWILAGCLVLSIAVMLWLSCASLVTAPDQHVKSQPLSISSDEESLVKSPLYGLSSVITVMIQDGEEEDDAGPLPMKVDLSKTLI
ncbi:transmembrane protein 59-like isoform X2 [Leucoraja erinacea]|uniref:transmembrane protein 59-like isoform X2 n=1 Tax=Leucoraja erinaceus TaxID=7782 RepID=UPI0024547D0B|nr:transmembrane protein 59-like isoform X2 [Leucoraja erinacea]